MLNNNKTSPPPLILIIISVTPFYICESSKALRALQAKRGENQRFLLYIQEYRQRIGTNTT